MIELMKDRQEDGAMTERTGAAVHCQAMSDYRTDRLMHGEETVAATSHKSTKEEVSDYKMFTMAHGVAGQIRGWSMRLTDHVYMYVCRT